MRYASLMLTAALFTAACDTEAEPEPGTGIQPQGSAEAPAPDAAPEQPEQFSLKGEWRVAGIDGKQVDLPTALTLSGGEQILDWDPECAQLAHRYTITDEDVFSAPRIRQFVTESARDNSKTPLHPPPCAIGLPEGLVDAMTAVESATKIERTEANGIRLSGYDRSITLFKQ